MKKEKIRTIIEHNPRLFEFVKFGIVGCTSLVILYVIYYILLKFIGHNLAYTIGYIFSFICNYYLTVKFTFKTRASKKNGAGFAISHIINYVMQVCLLNFFINLNIPKQIAPIPVFAICVPTNFVMVRYFMKN